MTTVAEPGVVRTNIPMRLDRLPWSRWHWKILVGLGTVWILDGLEVTIVSNISGQLAKPGSGIHITQSQVTGFGGASYVAGACAGALFFGWLTDRYGRKRLFMITLGVYLTATALTALAFSPWWFFLFRFVTGLGIGGEYAAINSAIDELIPARHRGKIDIVVNGTYWFGAAVGALLTIPLLTQLPTALGWRLAFGLGVLLGLIILLVRRTVPESPRWLFIHRRERDAEQLVAGVEQEVQRDTHAQLRQPEQCITVRQRRSIGFGTIARVMFTRYPRRSTLGFSLFVGQAFLFNAIIFVFAQIMQTFFHINPGHTGYYFAVIAAGSLLGPLLLSRLFDTVGRKIMISSSYLLSGALLLGTAALFSRGSLTATTMTACLSGVLFFASAGASSAYLTVSEIFPLETRALAIAFFFAIGTAAGGIAGPLLYARLVGTGRVSDTALAFVIGGSVMMAAGLVEVVLGVRAEQRSLEDIAEPLTAQEVDQRRPPGTAGPQGTPSPA
jgi:MFS family permease